MPRRPTDLFQVPLKRLTLGHLASSNEDSTSATGVACGGSEKVDLLKKLFPGRHASYDELAYVSGKLEHVELLQNVYILWLLRYLDRKYDEFFVIYERHMRYKGIIKSEALFSIVIDYLSSHDFTRLKDIAALMNEVLGHGPLPDGLCYPMEGPLLQSAFYLVGVITALYAPELRDSNKSLAMLETSPPRNMLKRPSKTHTWRTRFHSLDNASDGWIGDLLSRFAGGRNPIPYPAGLGQGTSEERQSQRRTEAVQLSCTNLSYYTLSELVGVKIVWVESICEHLEFDARSKTLKMFRYPSYCAAIATSGREPLFLYNILRDASATHSSSTDGSDTLAKGAAVDMAIEILCTFRLIFGQQTFAHQTYAAETQVSLFSRFAGFCSRLAGHERPELPIIVERRRLHHDDPLLANLCGQDWAAQAIYEDIDAPAVQSVYSVTEDFPYFGEKLALLQQFVSTRDVVGWKSLWRDRRDVHRYYTLWLVLQLGLVAVVLQLIAVGLGVAQVVGSFEDKD